MPPVLELDVAGTETRRDDAGDNVIVVAFHPVVMSVAAFRSLAAQHGFTFSVEVLDKKPS